MLKRYLFRSYRFLAGVQHWGRRRFTPAGVLALWCSLFAFVLGADTNFTMAYQALAFLICLLTVSLGWALVSRNKFTATRLLPRFGTVGVPLPYRVVVRNPTRRRQRNLALLEDLPDPRPSLEQFLATPEPGEEKRNWFDRVYGYYRWRWLLTRNAAAESAELPLPGLAPGAEIDARHRLVPRRRGPLRLESLTVAWPDPFGLVRSFCRVPCPQTVLILPKRYFVRPLALPGTLKYQQGGVALASAVGESQEFVALRDYRPGDPMRHIHWKSWAKAGKPIIREFQDEFFVRHALVLDTFATPAGSEAFEEAVSVAASFACTLPDQDSLLDLMFVGPEAYCFTAGRGLAHTEQLLEILASVSPCRQHSFAALETLVMQHLADVSGCVCVFLAWDADRQRLVQRLRVEGIPVQVLLIAPPGPAGMGEPNLGPLIDQPECFHRLVPGRVGEGLAQL